MNDHWTIVGRFPHAEQASMACGLLESEGIPAWIADDTIAGLNVADGIRVMARKDDLERAKILLENASDRFTLPDGFTPPNADIPPPPDPQDTGPRSWVTAFIWGGLAALIMLGALSSLFLVLGAPTVITAGWITLVFVLGGLVGFLIGPLLIRKR